MQFKHRFKKCRCCKKWFEPDPRTWFHQQYCTRAVCRKASKIASQKQWLAKPENRDHWRGPAQVERVQEWRRANPDYWKRKFHRR